MRLLSNLRVKGKPAVLPHHAIRRQSHYFIYRPRSCTSLNETTQAIYVQRNTEARSCNQCSPGKAISSSCSECVSVALVTQQAIRIRLFSAVVCLALPHFPNYLINGNIYGQKFLNLKCACSDFL